MVGRANVAIERATSKAKIEVISRVWSSCLQSSQSCRKLEPRKRTRQVPRSRTRLPVLPKTRTQGKDQQSNMVQSTINMMQNLAWHARYDMQCICVLQKENDEQGIKLANQVWCWKDDMISVEINIKITGIGCTVCKWQAIQERHNSAINSTMPSRMQQETKLLHSNMATKHMAVMFTRCVTKHEQWSTAKSQ